MQAIKIRNTLGDEGQHVAFSLSQPQKKRKTLRLDRFLINEVHRDGHLLSLQPYNRVSV